ncbi:MAG TPA: ABC-F family ATP-binding cassette domain-containing protein [Anaerolineae bacterium]
MSILTASNVSQSYGAFDVFKGVNVSIPNDGKIGLVGPNGIGKTTLLLILAGTQVPSTGRVHLARGRRIGYLRQEAMDAFVERDNTVYAEMLTVFAELRAQEQHLREMEELMAQGEMVTEGARWNEYHRAQEQFEAAGGYEYDTRIQNVLKGLGFSAASWEAPLRQLSGGQKTRALLARLLLERPDLLILDEPSNHLDIEAIEWLENTLRVWDGALLVVSHDRYFLDQVVNTIWEMSRTGIEVYRGNYSAYLTQRQERWEFRQQVYETEIARLEKELDFIKRNISGQNTDQAVGKLRRLSRELVAIEELGLLNVQDKNWAELGISARRLLGVDEVEQRIRAIRIPNPRPPKLNLHLHTAHRSGNIVLRANNVRVGYADAPLFTTDKLELMRQEIAALIGPNGSGKTTFLKTILGQLEPLSGQVELGASLKIGYFAQSRDELHDANTVFDELLLHKNMEIGQARSYLAQYLFRGDDVFKAIASLSGGERSRLALALLALEGANLLILDEPTNHLDIPAQEVLQEVLENFDGTVLLVTHDRYLVDELATQIWELQDGHLIVFNGPYREYLEARQRSEQEAKEARNGKKARTSEAQAAPVKRVADKQAKKRAEQLQQVEVKITELEVTLEQIAVDLQRASDIQNVERVRALSEEYAHTQELLEDMMTRWGELAEGVEQPAGEP